MGCRVVIGFDAVTGADQKFALLDNDRTDRTSPRPAARSATSRASFM